MKKLFLFMLVAFILVGAVSALESGNPLEVFAMSQNFEKTQSVNNENISVITTDTAPLVVSISSEQLIGEDRYSRYEKLIINWGYSYKKGQLSLYEYSRLVQAAIDHLRNAP